MSSGIRGITRAGHGKLIPTRARDIKIDVVYQIELQFPNGLDRSSPPPAEKVRASVSLTPRFDESYLPEGMYLLRTRGETWRLQKIGGSWNLFAEGVQSIMQTKLRVISPEKQ